MNDLNWQHASVFWTEQLSAAVDLETHLSWKSVQPCTHLSIVFLLLQQKASIAILLIGENSIKISIPDFPALFYARTSSMQQFCWPQFLFRTRVDEKQYPTINFIGSIFDDGENWG